MRKQNQRGVALIFALVMSLTASVMAVSLVFLARSEAFSSMNYRLMSQSRDAAEAGVNKAANFLMYAHAKPGGAGNPMSNYGRTGHRVTFGGNPVVLSANSNVASNYNVSGEQSAFSAAAQGTVMAGNTPVAYNASAQLLSMREVIPYGLTAPTTIETWRIISDGSVSGIQNSLVQVSSVLEQQVTPVFAYAAFADSAGCSALTFGGGGTTDSYDSQAALSGGQPVTSATDGNVGTNGNLSTSGNPTTINGTLSTPRTGVGTCSTSNVTAWTSNQGTVTGGLVELPQPVIHPTPTIPPAGTTNVASNAACPAGLVGCQVTGSGGGSYMTLNPSAAGGACASASPPNCTMSLGDVAMNGNADLHLAAGIYNINSLTQTGNTRLILDSVPVIVNVTGAGQTTVVNLTGGGLVNTTGNYDPMTFQILYAGTGAISLKGGANAVGVVYAPNAAYSFAGGGDWYGAIIGHTLVDMGGAAIHYDRRLSGEAYMVGNYTMGSFSWKKF